MSRLRIILDYRPALRERTGVGEYVHEMARALAALSSADAVVAFSSSWRDRLDSAGLPPGVTGCDRRVPVRLLNLAWHRLEWPPVERLAGAVDIAHSGHPLLMPARRAAQVITIHDLDFLDHPERSAREVRRDYPRLAYGHARRADLVVVSSAHTAGLVRSRLGVEDERLLLCPAGAPGWRPRPAGSQGKYLLFVGTLEPRKNVGTLLAAYERLLTRLPDAPPLHLAGRATPAADGWLDRIARPPLAGKVRHLGYVPADDRCALYADAAALVIPSLHEGFGLTALEAMTLGVPVVAANRGALPEVTGNAALLIDPADDGSLAAALERVLTDPALARELAEAGLRRAGDFSWERSAAALRQGYLEAMTRRRARR
jgi:glycosyltransferase involved in cell wall biosynthesis